MSNKKTKLIILVQALEQPRAVKRVIEKSTEYDEVYVYGFNRGNQKVNNYGILKNYDNIKLKVVGTMTDHQYLNRIGNFLRLLYLILTEHGISNKSVYAIGLDIRIASVLIFNSKIDYEISDIVWLYKTSYQKSILKKVDTFLARHANKVVFTSKGFYDAHYKKYVKPENVTIKENKFKTYGKVKSIEKIKKDQVRIAYIGAIRYVDILRNLSEVVKNDPTMILNFYGDGPKEIIDEIKKNATEYENIEYHGPFKNPDDLEDIYNENNLNFVVYDNRYENERIAMPNKYYESGFFNIPIVAAENTYVGKRVLDQKMGWIIGITKDEISNFLNQLDIDKIVTTHDHIKTLDKNLFEI
ncbi:MAG: hypothetical protein AB8B59_13770 [Maribacter sp.]